MNSFHLIFKDEEDQTSNLSVDWLIKFSVKYLIINNDNLVVSQLTVCSEQTDFELSNRDVALRFSDITSYWMRRGGLYFKHNDSGMPLSKQNYLRGESNTLQESIMALIYSKHGIGRIELNETNKIYNLTIAVQYGLQVPHTLVSSFKSVLEQALDQGAYCTKAIRQGYYTDGAYAFNGSTVLAKNKDVSKLNNITWPSLLQEYQEKRYELRIFYLDGDFYTSVIFSQNDEQTKVDFRHYNNARPNRTPPYQLPKHIEGKLHRLMQKLTIKCGSIDMVVNTKNEFVFLEVNPFGQFQQVSYPCNYYLELKVAEYLTKYDQKEKAIC